MVFLALSILIVSLSYLAYRYRIFTLPSQPSRFSEAKHAGNGRAPEPDDVHNLQEKLQPGVTVTAPGAHREESKRSHINATTSMKNPFGDEECLEQTRNAMPPPAFKPVPTEKSSLLVTSVATPSQNLKTTTSRNLPNTSKTTSLQPPPSAASIFRVPPGRTPSTSSLLSPSTSTLPPSTRPSRKVLLEPGHSPLDWAHITRNPPSSTFLRGADVPPSLIRVSPSLLKYHNGRKDRETGETRNAWGVWQGKVYNLSPYMKFHPGGEDQLMRGAGNLKAESLFNETHSWVSWDNMMGECLVGILVSENEARDGNAMEEID